MKFHSCSTLHFLQVFSFNLFGFFPGIDAQVCKSLTAGKYCSNWQGGAACDPGYYGYSPVGWMCYYRCAGRDDMCQCRDACQDGNPWSYQCLPYCAALADCRYLGTTGYYNTPASWSDGCAQQIACNPNYILDSSNTYCFCGSGYFITSSGACNICPTGKFSTGVDLTVCMVCSSGTYISTMGSNTCTKCESGKNI